MGKIVPILPHCNAPFCSKRLGKNGRSCSCVRCHQVLWCSKICQLRDIIAHQESCTGSDNASPHPALQCIGCGNKLSSLKKRIPCERCHRVYWCSKACLIKLSTDHERFCPVPPVPGIYSNAITNLQPTTTHPTPVLVKELVISQRNKPHAPLYRSGVFSLQTFTPGMCILAEEPEVVVHHTSLFGLLGRILSTGMNPTTYSLNGKLTPGATLCYGDSFQKQLSKYCDLYSVDLSTLNHYIHLIAWYSVIITTPLSGRYIGRALYPISSHLKHHCRPNAIRLIDGNNRSLLYCLKPIHAGEEICCNLSLPEISVLPVSARYEVLKGTYRNGQPRCDCSACTLETNDLSVRDTELGFDKLNLVGDRSDECSMDDFWENLQLRAIQPLSNPLVGDKVERSKMDEMVEQCASADVLRYVWYNNRYESLVSARYLVESKVLRSKVTLMGEPFTDLIMDYQRWVLILQHTAQTFEYFQQTHPLHPELVAELFTIMRWVVGGQFRGLKLSQVHLLQLTSQILEMTTTCMFQSPGLGVGIQGTLELWIRTFSTILCLSEVVPLDSKWITEMMSGLGLYHMTRFVPLFRQMMLSELQLNGTSGAFVLMVEVVRNLGDTTSSSSSPPKSRHKVKCGGKRRR